jgi:hypothetical protein
VGVRLGKEFGYGWPSHLNMSRLLKGREREVWRNMMDVLLSLSGEYI